MKEVYVVNCCRTAIGSFGGSLKDTPAAEMGAVVIKEALNRAGVKPENVDEVMFGCILTAGLGQNPARQAALKAGVPISVPAYTVGMVCGSGMKSVIEGARAILTGDANIVVAGGTEIQNAQPPVPQSQKGSAASLLQRGQRELGQRVLSPVKGRAPFADQRIAFIIRAPMADHIRHAAQRVRIHAPVQIQITTDPTHTRSPLFQRKSAPTPEQEPLFPVGR